MDCSYDDRQDLHAETLKLINDGGDLEKLTLNHCKAYLRKYTLKVSGSKSELVKRIKEHIQLKSLGGLFKFERACDLKNGEDSKTAPALHKPRPSAEDYREDTFSVQSDAKAIEAVDGGDFNKLKVDDCKIYLRHHNLKLSGSKAVLIDRITKHFKTETDPDHGKVMESARKAETKPFSNIEGKLNAVEKNTEVTENSSCVKEKKLFGNSKKLTNGAGDNLENFTVEDCKCYLREHGLRLTGSKSVLVERIQEHLKIKDGSGQSKYLPSTFTIDCTGDCCIGDVVLFTQTVYSKYDPLLRCPLAPPLGERVIAARIVKESYGAQKQQHTFTVEVLWSTGVEALPALHQLIIKGRNLYRLRTSRQLWENEEDRKRVLQEKHRRGGEARRARTTRMNTKAGWYRSKQKKPEKISRPQNVSDVSVKGTGSNDEISGTIFCDETLPQSESSTSSASRCDYKTMDVHAVLNNNSQTRAPLVSISNVQLESVRAIIGDNKKSSRSFYAGMQSQKADSKNEDDAGKSHLILAALPTVSNLKTTCVTKNIEVNNLTLPLAQPFSGYCVSKEVCHPKQDGTVLSLNMKIMASVAGRVIGKQGRNIKEIRKISGAEVQMWDDRRYPAFRIVGITGRHEQVELASRMIIQSVPTGSILENAVENTRSNEFYAGSRRSELLTKQFHIKPISHSVFYAGCRSWVNSSTEAGSIFVQLSR